MNENISTQPVSNKADANGLNVLDKQKRQDPSHHAPKYHPLMPMWRVYRISYCPASQRHCLDKKYVDEKRGAVK